jgi:hypothetical protein
MDYQAQREFQERFRNCSDDELAALLADGPESFQEGVFPLVQAEARRRGLRENDASASPESDAPATDLPARFADMSRERLLALTGTLDAETFTALVNELVRREVESRELLPLRPTAPAPAGGSPEGGAPASAAFVPLLSVDTPEETDVFLHALRDASIPHAVQISVPEADLEKAQSLLDRRIQELSSADQ